MSSTVNGTEGAATPQPSSDAPPSSSPPPPSSTPAPPPPSSSAAPSAAPSSRPPPPPSSSNTPNAPSSDRPSSPPSSAPPVISTVTASAPEPSTQVITSLVTPTASIPGETPSPSIVFVTTVINAPNAPQPTNALSSAPAAPTNSADPALQAPKDKANSGAGGLSPAGRTAIAVVVPVVVVAILVAAGIMLWRRRKQRRNAEDARRKEVEEYGFNPNNDPTLPAVGISSEMAEDQSGYRGWGNTATSSNRKASTTLNSGMAYSDSNSNPGGYHSPGSPTQVSDGMSGDPLVNGRRETLDSEGIAALGAAPNANQTREGVARGSSNASSSYSAANRSDNSGEYQIPSNNPSPDYYDQSGYYPPGTYGPDAYGANQQPVIRDVSARRNTRIENPSVFPQQGNSGIAQNF
ncbi:hypothetical protein BDV95DRAFT_386394 [Massariosphaeria phaeospora]|uniref:Uncharacterized protein n=1 Tax=Massariosphaeria phaeospora TaxID=100035 RepID=A0A7C8MD95_9PLEO|nr:hypothetical protein BDV95DRAFT_386394 [Massariosphaeria phaeospora]